MTHPTITCERFNEQLADFLERAVSEPTRAAMESHAVGCDDCGPLLADLRRLRIEAANLTELAPSRDLWSGIAARIEAPVVAMPGIRQAPSPRWSRPVWFGIAAAALIAATATITHEMTKRSLTANAPTQAAKPLPASTNVASTDSQPAVQPSSRLAVQPSARPAVHPTTRLASNKPSAEQTYDQEIARLLVVYNKRRPDLDSTTIAVVKKNLKIIDDAIAQTRLALKRDPASQFLMESLNDAFDTKVQLLRKAAMLPSGT
jgi:hypothetical protein